MAMSLRLDYCSYEAAKFAVEHWHYSKCLPAGKLIKLGVWENKKYIGCVIYGRGACMHLGKSFGLNITEICELTRVALRSHINSVSKIVSISIRILKKYNPKMKLIFSFADPRQDHKGIIYQAGNWVYTGKSSSNKQYLIKGKWTHPRSVGSKYGTTKTKFIERMGFATREAMAKHRYLYPLNNIIRKQIEPLRKPYPKRLTSKDSVAADNQSVEGGASPTVRLL